MADRKKRVLVVDDAGLVRLYYRQILEEAGFEVEEALNGLEALEKLLASPPTLDRRHQHAADGRHHLPEALRRQALPLSSIPALVTSTESKAADIAAARAAGANFYSVKPVGREASRAHHGDVLRRAPMNEFIEQFLVEARELVEQATADLLALEATPATARAWMALSAPFTP